MSANALAKAENKVLVCHRAGAGKVVPIRISPNAVKAHLDKGGFLPGQILSEGTKYSGKYGGTVTPLKIAGEDCATKDAVRTDAEQRYSGGGWAGWSCVETGYPFVLDGGVTPDTASAAVSLAWKPGASTGEIYYPSTPFGYTYNNSQTPPEEGWIAQAGTPIPTGIYVICGKAP